MVKENLPDCVELGSKIWRFTNARTAISSEMALRIEAWLGKERGGDARLWLAQQSAHDLWQAAQQFKLKPMRVTPAPANGMAH
jgi:plasmid maintenance system antidote protein VapI